MGFRLTKHHGLGNDFLVHLTDDAATATDRRAWVERAPRWCDRRRGIGADGLLIGLTGKAAADLGAETLGASEAPVDVVMTLINADGSVAEMSGNGIRCLAQAVLMAEPGTETLRILTDAGVREVSADPSPDGDPTTIVASVDMGAAGPGPEPDRSVDIDPSEVPAATADALALAPLRSATFDLGNPHLVLLVPDPEVIDLVAAGSTHEAAFADGMNVHFVAPTAGETDAITMRVWERGAGVTEACGTGATAVARAAHDWGLVGERVSVHMPGGDVVVDVADSMTLHGPASFISSCEVPA
jgi:diaminopimelate epimerase